MFWLFLALFGYITAALPTVLKEWDCVELFVPILCVWVPFNLLLGVAILRR